MKHQFLRFSRNTLQSRQENQLENTHMFGYTDLRRSGGFSVFVGVAFEVPYIRRDGGGTPHGRCGLLYGLTQDK
ncbi:MAG: hypothetical protein FWF18_06210 [Dehalococcoidia bacterium]|nr:hypothetical protein [Dehalococcoidia bacterium]